MFRIFSMGKNQSPIPTNRSRWKENRGTGPHGLVRNPSSTGPTSIVNPSHCTCPGTFMLVTLQTRRVRPPVLPITVVPPRVSTSDKRFVTFSLLRKYSHPVPLGFGTVNFLVEGQTTNFPLFFGRTEEQ